MNGRTQPTVRGTRELPEVCAGGSGWAVGQSASVVQGKPLHERGPPGEAHDRWESLTRRTGNAVRNFRRSPTVEFSREAYFQRLSNWQR